MSAATTSTESLVTRTFWAMCPLDVVGVLIILVSTLRYEGSSHNDGGSESGIFL